MHARLRVGLLAAALCMAPLAAQIQNGTFEDGGGSLDEWSSRGGVEVGTGLAPTGDHGASMPAGAEGTSSTLGRTQTLAQSFDCPGPAAGHCWVKVSLQHTPGPPDESVTMFLERDGQLPAAANIPAIPAPGADYQLSVPGCGRVTVTFFRWKTGTGTFVGSLVIDNVEAACAETSPFEGVPELAVFACPSGNSALCSAVGTTLESLLHPLTTTFATDNHGAAGGAIYFDLAADGGDVAIGSFDLDFQQAAGASGTLQVYTTPGSAFGVETNAVAWTLHDSATVPWTGGIGKPSNCVFTTTPLVVQAGTSIGVAVVAGPTLTHAYTNGSATVPTQYARCPLRLSAGSASNAPFAGTVFTPRVPNVNVYYTHTAPCATVTAQGPGCTTAFASCYDLQFAATMDLAGKRVAGTSHGGAPHTGYLVTTGNAPGGIAPGVGAIALALGDDDQVAVGTLGLVVGSNGWLALGPGNSNAYVPTRDVFLNNPRDAIAAWTDLQPNAAGSGRVWYEESGTSAVVTWHGVYGFGTTGPNTFRITYDTASGDFAIEFGALAPTNPQSWIVGFSPGGASADPGSSDLSPAGSAIVTAGADAVPLTLTALGRPVQGSTALPFAVTTSNFEPGAVMHVGLVGLGNPGVPLSVLGFGSGDCYLNASPDVVTAVVLYPAGPQIWNVLALPAAPPSFLGFPFHCQAMALALGAFSPASRSSNGLKCVVGDL